MPLDCNWGNTPAFTMLKPIWDSIDRDEDTNFRATDAWKAQPALVHLLDALLMDGMWVPNIVCVNMCVGQSSITEDNVAEVYGRMRTWEELTDSRLFRNIGTYDEKSNTYTPCAEDERGNSLSPWMLSQFIDYRTNWGNESRTEWVRGKRKSGDEFGRYTTAWINGLIDKYADEYRAWDDNHDRTSDVQAYVSTCVETARTA